MDITSLDNGITLSPYATKLLAKQQGTAGGATTGSADALTSRLASRLAAAPTDFRTGNAQHQLDRQQAALGKELAAGLAKSGARLGGSVSLGLAQDGSVAVEGSDADKAAVAKVLKGDTSTPRLQARLGTLLKDARSLSATTQQHNAISLAARYGGASGNVMAMYAQFMGHVDSTPATLRFDGAASTLHYPGALDSHA